MIGRNPRERLASAKHFSGRQEDQLVAFRAPLVLFLVHGERQPSGVARQLPVAGAARPRGAPHALGIESSKRLKFIRHAVDHNQLDLGLGIRSEETAVGDHQVCNLSGFDRAEPLPGAHEFRGYRGERGQCGVFIEPALYCGSQIGPELVPGIFEPVVGEGEGHTRLRQKRGVRWGKLPVLELLQRHAQRTVRRVDLRRVGEVQRDDDPDSRGSEQFAHPVLVAVAHEHDIQVELILNVEHALIVEFVIGVIEQRLLRVDDRQHRFQREIGSETLRGRLVRVVGLRGFVPLRVVKCLAKECDHAH